MNVSGAALILFIFSFLNCYAQLNPGAKQISISHSDVASIDDVFSLFNNPAGLAEIKWREFGIYYSPAPFGFYELSSSFAAYSEPLSFGSAAFGIMTYGYKLYRETKIVGGFSYQFNESFNAGISITYHMVKIQNYGTDQSLYADLGAIIKITNEINFGVSFYNLNKASFGESEGQIPVVFISGFSYEPISRLCINAALEKDLIFEPSICVGIDFKIIDHLSLRSGLSTMPDNYSAGVGIFYSIFNLDYAFITHPSLGLTHQAGLLIRFGGDNFIN
jgi:hypothetical protein